MGCVVAHKLNHTEFQFGTAQGNQAWNRYLEKATRDRRFRSKCKTPWQMAPWRMSRNMARKSNQKESQQMPGTRPETGT